MIKLLMLQALAPFRHPINYPSSFSRTPTTTIALLVGPLLRARHGREVGRGVRPAVELDRSIADLVAAGDADGGPRRAAVVAAGNVEMRALYIPFLLAVRGVHAHLLDAHEVLAGGDLGRQPELPVLHLVRQPALVGAVPRHLGAQLVHFEPVARAVVVADVAGGLGEVDLGERRQRTVVARGGSTGVLP